jgi:hypothetical protein
MRLLKAEFVKVAAFNLEMNMTQDLRGGLFFGFPNRYTTFPSKFILPLEGATPLLDDGDDPRKR